MDPTSWSAYSQHFSRLGASMNHPPGALAQTAQINDLALSSSLPRQEHIPGYGNTGGAHHFLLAASHGLNPPQPSNHNDPSFNANLFAANYDASLFGSSFQSNKGHLSSFSQGPGLFKAVSRESDFNDLRTGFSHCGMSPYARNPEANASLPGGSGLGSGPLFPNSMPPGSWRHSGMIPPSCGPFGVLPHETVLQRSHLVSRGGDKLSVQSAKQSRSSHPNNAYVEQDLSRGYRSILTSPARPPSSYVDSSNTSHSSLLSPQGDPYFSSVSDNYYSSCSKNDFAAYSSYCTNVQPPVQRSAISPYCYPQTFGAFDPNIEKQDATTSNPSASANSNFSNFVPNNNLNSNPTHMHNGQISRQSVITSNVTNNSVIYNSESHHQNHPYNHRETYPYPPVSTHAASCQPAHSSNSNSSGSSSGRHVGAHLSNSHHSTGQPAYPPMSTPIPASTPAHPTPSSSIGQAYVPTPLPMSHDSGCSSVNSQSVMYNSPSNDGCYSTPGTCHSESGSPAKQDGSHHSSPSMYSVDNSNLSVNSSEPFVDPNRMHPHPSSDGSYVNNSLINETNASDVQDSRSNTAAKHLDGSITGIDSSLMSSGCASQPKNVQIPSIMPIDMAKVGKANNFQNVQMERSYENEQLNIRHGDQDKNNKSHMSEQPKCLMTKSDVFSFSSDSPPALDCTQKLKQKGKRGRKRKSSSPCLNPVPLNCTYAHLENTPQPLSSPHETQQVEENLTVNNNSEPFYKKSPTPYNELPPIPSSSSPVDLSHVSLNLSVKKQEAIEEKEKIVSPQDNQSSSYETSTMSSNHWADSQDNSITEDKKVQDAENSPKENESEVKSETKEETICQMPPMDDLSDESKKLCNSIEDDLGFLAELSSDPDVEDSTSKSSFSGKNRKKNQGFLQSFLTFLEGREEPGVSNPASDVAKDEKTQKAETSGLKVKETEVKKSEASSDMDQKKEETKKDLIEDNDDKDNFDEAPSLDPALFGCSTLQKEMVVPNPEAPSFSSDEDENSAQGIFDSVAMAIQRLCEDNEEDHNDKTEKTDNVTSSKSKDEMPVLTSIKEAGAGSESEEKEDKECMIKTACVVKTKRGKRRRTRHLLVIKVKRTEKNPVISKTFKATTKTRKTRNGAKASESMRSQRRPLMRKCKEKETKKRNTNRVKRKPRNSVKKKYTLNEATDAKPESITVPEVIPENEEVDMQLVEKKEPTVTITLIPPVPDILPKKQRKLNKTRQKRRRRGHHHHKKVEVAPVVNEKPPEPITITVEDEDANNMCNDESLEMKVNEKCSNNGENNWNTETHFKTGDFVTSVESKNNENPPIWRIEGKNVLQLFEAIEEERSKPLYRNTSSYSRWSPSSKHKYSKQPVKIIKSDDDTVIVELIKKSENTDHKEISGSRDYTVHPQRENFEVYLQTLVSHALDPDFIPEILKENDEYFLSHLQAIEKINFEKKGTLLQCDEWDSQLLDSVKMYPYVSVSMSKENEKSLCQVCNNNKIQFMVHFHGQLYDPTTLENKAEGKNHPVCDFNFPLCGPCVQVVTLYSRLHHHKYHFFQLGCKKVKDVKRGEEKNSHVILEECLQDTEWMAQMFHDMLEMWNACDRYR